MDQIADHLPKLMPLWHDQSIHDIVNSDRRFLDDNLPDYGGIGVDISLKKKGPLQSIVKHAVDSVHFQAEVCTLPFLPANKVSMGTDPCLSSLHTSRENFRRFCVKLKTLRSQVKLKRCENYKKEILSAYKIVQKMCRSGNYTKVLLPEILVELATIFPKSLELPDVNLDYFGCLASCNKANENPILLYPTGKNLSKLAVTTLEHSSDMYKTFQPVESQGNIVTLDSGAIQQINCAFDGYCYILQNKVTHFVDFNDLSNISHFRCLAQRNVTNIGASHYCPVELLSTYENGMMEMYNIDRRQTLWSIKNSQFSVGIEKTVPLSCSFGSHPKSVLCITDRQLYSFDVRSEDHKGCVIFSSYHPTCYRNEHLTCMKGLLTNPFQYFISSSHHLFLSDERYPNKPVLLWNHLLKASPLYCDVASYNATSDSSDVVVLLGTQKSQELVSFSVNSRHSPFQPTVSLGPPLFLSSPSDCFRSLKFHCADIDQDIVKRLSSSLVGITAIPHNNKAGFTAFQITSPGDVFFQDFRTDLSIDSQNVERTYRADMGCVLTPPNRIWPHVSNWNRNYKKNQTHSDAYDVSRIHVDLKDFLCKHSEVSSECSVCATYKLAHNREIISSESCPTCGLEDTQSEHLMKASNELSLIIGPATEDCDLSEFDTTSFFQFTDSFSKKILQAWSHEEETDYVLNTEAQSEEHSYSDVLETFSPASSYNNTPVKKLQLSAQGISNITSQLHSQNSLSFMDETLADISLYSQGSMEEFVPPSQEIRPVAGETLRTPKQIKTKLSKKITSSAGF
ncbi:hypothetical protein AVEN_169689-1 [Araneus ventricosus]|uniref:TATA box-binding protein-associated factor RNA polymerase I subunit C n=1 Tax=Araneus ventricosus TaxID=182803 RepID=A0A4Y2D125_ARAVE|nr:hypothetical protein AVEN_169689-1 [Araneus ventricosus]